MLNCEEEEYEQLWQVHKLLPKSAELANKDQYMR